VCLACGWGEAKSNLSPPQLLQAAFPSYQVERKTLFLTDSQTQRIEQLSRTKLDSRVISYYVARSSAGVAGIAFFDRRMVRTLPVTYMAVVNASGTLGRVEVLSFEEPDEYLPPDRWLALYKNHGLDDNLAIGRGIPHITGASLTSQAMNDGLRTILSIYQVAVKGTLG
jgi:Na+-translocating ferredoxin:NAD+ oxidoreductase subunit G